MNRTFIKNTFIALGLLLPLTLPAQEAVAEDSVAPQKCEKAIEDPVKDTLIVKPGRVVSVLYSANGWIRDDNGHWVSSPNRIPYINPDYNNEYYDKYKLGSENFRQIRVQEVRVNGALFYAIIVQFTKGYYKNEEQNEDWRYYNSADYYLVKKADFQKLLNDSMKFNKPYHVSMRLYYSGNVPAGDISTVPGKMIKDINAVHKTMHLYDTTVKAYYQMALYPVSDKRGKRMRFNTGLAYARIGSTPPPPSFSTFSSQYYEVPYERFREFVKPK